MNSTVKPGFSTPSHTTVLVLIGIAALTGWAFWPTFTGLVHLWNTDDGYSHGYLVPAFSAYLLWTRREQLPKSLTPRPLLGLSVIALAWALRIVAGLRFN